MTKRQKGSGPGWPGRSNTRAPPDLADKFRRAGELLQAGRPIQAEVLYREILSWQPRNVAAQCGLGTIAFQCRDDRTAVAHFRKAAKLSPSDAAAHLNYGLALLRTNRYSDALASFSRAQALKPQQAQAYCYRGDVLGTLNRYDEALASYDEALAKRPDFAEALVGRGNALADLGRFEEALPSYDRALVLQPDLPEALDNRGLTLSELQRFDEALESFDRALAVKPDYADAHYHRATLLSRLGRVSEALPDYYKVLALEPDNAQALLDSGAACVAVGALEQALTLFDRSLALQPDRVETFCDRAVTLNSLARFDEALASCEQALTLRPGMAMALALRGWILRNLGRYDEAFATFSKAAAKDPGNAEFFNAQGVTYCDLNRYDDAIASFDRALSLRSDFASARYNQAMAYLALGDFAHGLPAFESRWGDRQFAGLRRDYGKPLWMGEDSLAGRTILLHAEQGYGDTIQFCRYAQMLVDQGARVVIEVQPALKRLLRSLTGIHQIVGRGELLPNFDVCCPLLSLPLAFGTRLESIPGTPSYLSADGDLVQGWRQRLPTTTRRRVGVVWAGSARHLNDRRRSLPLSLLLALRNAGVELVSLQKDIGVSDRQVLGEHPELLDVSAELKDFADTAALIACLDLVISVDTSVAHLAGAMGKPVWILLPVSADWRWLLGRDDSPWYPSARLFRQTAMGDCTAVIERVTTQLKQLTALT